MRTSDMMRRSMTRALAGVCALWFLDGCAGDDDGSRTRVCTPGAHLSCDCPNGRTSTASCLPNGSGVGPCACSDPVDASPGTEAGMSWMHDGATPMGPRDAGDASMMSASGSPADAASGDDAASADAAVPSAGCGAADPPSSGSMTLDVNGTERRYIVRVPADYDPMKPHRLVFAWHGLGGTAMQISSSYYGLAARAGSSAIFIAAQGLSGAGFQAGLAAWSNVGDRDVTFTRALLEWAKANYCIDVKRVFSIGMSNGAMMSNVVGCELGDAFRAIAAVAGGGPRGYAMAPCTGQVAVWIAHGNRDGNVPFSYGTMSRDYWRNTNDCGTETAATTAPPCVEYQGCDEGYPVQFCEFDGGHMVPSFTADAVWDFFQQF